METVELVLKLWPIVVGGITGVVAVTVAIWRMHSEFKVHKGITDTRYESVESRLGKLDDRVTQVGDKIEGIKDHATRLHVELLSAIRK